MDDTTDLQRKTRSEQTPRFRITLSVRIRPTTQSRPFNSPTMTPAWTVKKNEDVFIGLYADAVFLWSLDVIDTGDKIYVDVVDFINALRHITPQEPNLRGFTGCYLASEFIY